MRDKTIDGFRAIAALGVVFAHAVLFRFGDIAWLHYPQRAAEALSITSVEIFFVISGYIITTLLIKERETGNVSLTAFYIRRVCRIVPPLAVLLLTVAAFELTDPASLAMASTFTCNIGDCAWAVAHTWSLSVEEQFYILWPILLITVLHRARYIALGVALLLTAFLVVPFTQWGNNYVSFACIGSGAFVAMAHPQIRSSGIAWMAVALFLLLAPLYLPLKLAGVLLPFAIVYLLFGVPEWARRILALWPFQVIGLGSYSLYLWQQLFFTKGSDLPLWLLPIVVTASVLIIERPFIRIGRKLSKSRTPRGTLAARPS